jgi:hypothetical protein
MANGLFGGGIPQVPQGPTNSGGTGLFAGGPPPTQPGPPPTNSGLGGQTNGAFPMGNQAFGNNFPAILQEMLKRRGGW